jgi:excinuclease UvrABC ATPase subunit
MTEPPLPQTPLSETPLLEMRKVSKEYRGVAALKNIDFQLRRGEVHAIVGENGAGKSTLVKILSGVVAPSAGEIRLAGDRIEIAGPALARRYGIVMVYQETGGRRSARSPGTARRASPCCGAGLNTSGCRAAGFKPYRGAPSGGPRNVTQ